MLFKVCSFECHEKINLACSLLCVITMCVNRVLCDPSFELKSDFNSNASLFLLRCRALSAPPKYPPEGFSATGWSALASPVSSNYIASHVIWVNPPYITDLTKVPTSRKVKIRCPFRQVCPLYDSYVQIEFRQTHAVINDNS